MNTGATKRSISPDLDKVITILERPKKDYSGDFDKDIKKHLIPLLKNIRFFQMDSELSKEDLKYIAENL